MNIQKIIEPIIKQTSEFAKKAGRKLPEIVGRKLPEIAVLTVSTYFLGKLYLENRNLKEELDNRFDEGYEKGTYDTKANYKTILDSFTTRDFCYLVVCETIVYFINLENDATKEQLKKLEEYLNLYIKTPGIKPELKTRLEEVRSNKVCLSQIDIFINMDKLLERCNEKEKTDVKTLFNNILSDLMLSESCNDAKKFYKEWCNKYK